MCIRDRSLFPVDKRVGGELEPVSPAGSVYLTFAAIPQAGRQIVVPSINNGAVFRAGKGRTASDFNGNILLQIVHAAAHTQQPRSKLPVADSGTLADSSDFFAYLRKNIPQDFCALFSMLPLKCVEMQGEGCLLYTSGYMVVSRMQTSCAVTRPGMVSASRIRRE